LLFSQYIAKSLDTMVKDLWCDYIINKWMHFISLFLFFFWWYWGMNSGLHAWRCSTTWATLPAPAMIFQWRPKGSQIL
jgi:hypothetical protein